LHAKLNARLATLRHDVTARAAARAETDQARETNPDLTDFAKQSARRKVKGATLLLRHASSGGGAGGVVVTDSNAEVGRGERGKGEGREGGCSRSWRCSLNPPLPPPPCFFFFCGAS
jgi:hypothetical protein